MTSLSSFGSLGSSSSRRSVVELVDPRARAPSASAANDASSRGELAGGARGRRGRPRASRAASRRSARARRSGGRACGPGLVGVHRGVGELALELGVLGAAAPRATRLTGSHAPCRSRSTVRTDTTTAPVGRDRGSALPAPYGRARRWRWRTRSCRSASRTCRRGRRCRGSSACPCRTGGRRADVGVDRAARGGAAGGERVAAGAGDRGLVVLGVDVGLHRGSLCRGGRRVVPR